MKTIVSNIIKHAIANYENGWDVFVECYSKKELEELFIENNISTFRDAKKECELIIEAYEIKKQNQSEY